MNLPLLSSVLLTIAIVKITSAHNSFKQRCRDAPTPAMKILCLQLQEMDTMARFKHAMVPTEKPPSVVLSPVYDCQNITCLCPYFRGSIAKDGSICILKNGKRLERAIRKEIRYFSEDERERFHRAMNNLKRSGEYKRLGQFHHLASSQGGVHSGPAFLPWHREYLKRMEIAIRLLEPDLALPYWDSVLDQNMPDARDSVLWSPAFYGESDSRGRVKNGPYAKWTTIEGPLHIIRRDVGEVGTLFTEDHLRIIQEQPSVVQVMAFTAPREGCPMHPDWDSFEYLHGNPHLWVGGEMVDPEKSVNDPVFFQHHAFVDLIWERWRLAHQNRSSRETEYPPNNEDCSNVRHFSTADMFPFAGIRNRDGLSNHYTEVMYTIAARPNCSTSNPDCGSPYLFCDVAHTPPRCVSKARKGGRCDGFEEMDICYSSRCWNGRCVSHDLSYFVEPWQFKEDAFDDGKRNNQNSSNVITTVLSITAGLGLIVGFLWAVLPMLRRPFLGNSNVPPVMNTVKETFSESSTILRKWEQGDAYENINKYGSTVANSCINSR